MLAAEEHPLRDGDGDSRWVPNLAHRSLFIIPRDRYGNVNVTAASCGRHRVHFVNVSLPNKGGAANLTTTTPFAAVDTKAGVCKADFIASHPSGTSYPLLLAQMQVVHVASSGNASSSSGTTTTVLERQVSVLPPSSSQRVANALRTFTFGGGSDADAHLRAGDVVTLAVTPVDSNAYRCVRYRRHAGDALRGSSLTVVL